MKASLPEVNQFTGNCFRVVRIVLKITFLGLRYSGQRPECLSLSYYGSWLKLFVKILSISVAVLEVILVGRVINGKNILEYIVSNNSPVVS